MDDQDNGDDHRDKEENPYYERKSPENGDLISPGG
jgi:hypothetical protein